ncbi:hypothetical protein APS67_001246 [Streptomyces sp. AVP053U2]|uniref:hypothetical protein n=1 Tax=unclassified Streptomyces TaxID=2593676 RepID=UPI00073B3142|nr:hypothetical protein [Streptomyces sp. NBRC 110035]ODA74584.1 hypothetical protein APS67_001246 [Streptomyces sp. AVP053U2]
MPGRVNPTVVNCAAFVLLATAVLLWFGIARLTRGGASRTAAERLVRVDPSLVTCR